MCCERSVVLGSARSRRELEDIQATHLRLAQAVVDSDVHRKEHLTVGSLELSADCVVQLHIPSIDACEQQPQDIDVWIEATRDGADRTNECIHTIDCKR